MASGASKWKAKKQKKRTNKIRRLKGNRENMKAEHILGTPIEIGQAENTEAIKSIQFKMVGAIYFPVLREISDLFFDSQAESRAKAEAQAKQEPQGQPTPAIEKVTSKKTKADPADVLNASALDIGLTIAGKSKIVYERVQPLLLTHCTVNNTEARLTKPVLNEVELEDVDLLCASIILSIVEKKLRRLYGM